MCRRGKSFELFGVMDSLLKQFSDGVLNNLEDLDVAARSRRETKQQLTADKKSLCQLQRKLAALKQRKNDLQKKLKTVEENLAPDNQPQSKRQKTSDEMSDDLVKLKKLTEIANFYKLTGISVESVGENKIVLRFDSSCDGVFSKSYFVEVQKEWNHRVHHHTLPSFVPVVDLAARCDLQTFVSKTRQYLSAFTSRQNQVKVFQAGDVISTQRATLNPEVVVMLMFLKENMKLTTDCSAVIQGELEISLPIDYVEMTITPFENTCPLHLSLVYDNLMDNLPTSVSLEAVVSDSSDIAEPSDTLLQQWTELFKTMSITKALMNIVNMEIQSVSSDFTSEL